MRNLKKNRKFCQFFFLAAADVVGMDRVSELFLTKYSIKELVRGETQIAGCVLEQLP